MDDHDSGSLELADYTALLRRRWWIVALGIVVGIALAAGYLGIASKAYTSTASVLVTPTGTEQTTTLANGRTNSEINLDTEAQLVTSTVVSRLARQTLHTVTSTQDLADKVTVTVPANTAVLNIAFTASSPAAAQQGAAAFAQAYLKNRATVAQNDLNQQIKLLRDEIGALSSTLSTVSGQVAALSPATQQGAYARSQQTLLQSRISDLNAQLGPLTTRRITPGSVISPATRPSGPTSPRALLVLVSGVAGGLVLGLIAALIVDRLDDRIRREADLARLPGLPVLARVAATTDPVRHRKVFSRLRGELAGRGDPLVVALVGADAQAAAVHLARAYAAGGTPTRLLDCGDGTAPLEEQLTGLRAAARHAVVGVPPARPDHADPVACAALADTVVVVVQFGRTRGRALVELVHAVQDAGTPVAGVLLLPRAGRGAPAIPAVPDEAPAPGPYTDPDTLVTVLPRPDGEPAPDRQPGDNPGR